MAGGDQNGVTHCTWTHLFLINTSVLLKHIFGFLSLCWSCPSRLFLSPLNFWAAETLDFFTSDWNGAIIKDGCNSKPKGLIKETRRWGGWWWERDATIISDDASDLSLSLLHSLFHSRSYLKTSVAHLDRHWCLKLGERIGENFVRSLDQYILI